MKLYAGVFLGFLLTSCSQLPTVETAPTNFGRNTVKIQALSANGKQNLGSGVVIAPDTIATNCHIMRSSQRAFVIEPDGLYPVITQAALPNFDVCIVKTDHLNLPVATLADSDSVKVGDDIVLSGYPFGLSLQMKQGKVTALHPQGNGRIIEVNVGFNHGASGGGVFDSSGKLIGLMTFMGSEAEVMHFYVIPAAWLAMGLEQKFVPLKPFKDRSFWEKGEFVKEAIK